LEIIRADSGKNKITIQGSPQEILNMLDSYLHNIDHVIKESRGIIEPKYYNSVVGRKRQITKIITIIKGILNNGKS